MERKATQSLPHKSPFFGASYSFYKTGQYTRFGGYEQARQGGVLFCGEHTSVDFQGFMEGAASEANARQDSSSACWTETGRIRPHGVEEWLDVERRHLAVPRFEGLLEPFERLIRLSNADVDHREANADYS